MTANPEFPLHAHPQSRDTQITSSAQGASIIQVEASKLLPWIMLIAILSGLAVGLAVLSIVLSQQSEREAKLAREDVIVLEKSMIARGIQTDQHAIEKGK